MSVGPVKVFVFESRIVPAPIFTMPPAPERTPVRFTVPPAGSVKVTPVPRLTAPLKAFVPVVFWPPIVRRPVLPAGTLIPFGTVRPAFAEKKRLAGAVPAVSPTVMVPEPAALFESSTTVPFRIVIPPVCVFVPLSVSVPLPVCVSDPAPVWSTAAIAKFPVPAVVRLMPVPEIVAPPTVMSPPLFVHVCVAPRTTGVAMVCAPAPGALVMPPVPSVRVFAPPIVALPPVAVKFRLFTEKFAPSVLARFAAPLLTEKNTSVVAPGIWFVLTVPAAVVDQFVRFVPAPKEFHCVPCPPFQ